MAIAAYASLVSLTHVLDNVHYRSRFRRLHGDIKQIESLREGVDFLLDFLEVRSEKEVRDVDLLRQLSKIAFEAEEMFDLHVVDQHLLRYEGVKPDLGISAFNDDMEGVIQKIEFIKKKLLLKEEVLEDVHSRRQPKVFPRGGASLTTSSVGKKTIVGFDEHVIAIIDVLTRDESKLEIIPIVGMGGIGKTTLAKAVFDNQYISDHFDRRIWLTISEEYTVHDILVGLLYDGEVIAHDGSLDGLGQALYQQLFGSRYLIVMDDVWSEQAWYDLRMFFPNNNNKSRIMMTTRLSNVASSLGTHKPYSMTLLDTNKSWNLFCQAIFGNKDCPYPELEEFGRKIVESCKGLPLEIIVIGGLLAKSDMSRNFWEFIADDISSFGNSRYDEHCIKILSLSYNNLPIHLKPCFLFVGSYPEDQKIVVTDLIQRWIANGLFRAIGEKSLEDIAMDNIKDLISRNLISVHSLTTGGEIKTCGIHDLLRDLCLKELDNEKFIQSPKVQDTKYTGAQVRCFLCGHENTYQEVMNIPDFDVLSPSLSSPLSPPSICAACSATYSHVTRARLVGMVSDAYDHLVFVHPTQARYVSVYSAVDVQSILPASELLWNIQTLKIVVSSSIVFPDEIWEMPQLRHLQVSSIATTLPDPVAGKGSIILKNLQTLFEIQNFKCTKEVLNRIPDLKTLRITFNSEFKESMASSDCSLFNLIQLKKLQSLQITRAWENVAFPKSLKELSLKDCSSRVPWSRLSIIGLLPNLEKLELINATVGSEWNPIEGEFLRLKNLIIWYSDLVQWTADKEHFPTLERLQLWSLKSLEEIPLGIGDIPTLNRIELIECSRSAIDSAWQIWEEQQSMENETLEIFLRNNMEWYSISDFMARQIEENECEDED
ncbi:late blight resistance protein R1-A-like [Andrographis paniculata]|uniref:late blight resistance protein R1-A-like n=1 Tax=Andrographis paniculata TaxID=175694 RepID=UPI0021E972AC|nr:late blight resistance protein R1-A-like [Andrographis paniculata]